MIISRGMFKYLQITMVVGISISSRDNHQSGVNSFVMAFSKGDVLKAVAALDAVDAVDFVAAVAASLYPETAPSTAPRPGAARRAGRGAAISTLGTPWTSWTLWTHRFIQRLLHPQRRVPGPRAERGGAATRQERRPRPELPWLHVLVRAAARRRRARPRQLLDRTAAGWHGDRHTAGPHRPLPRRRSVHGVVSWAGTKRGEALGHELPWRPLNG